MVRNTNLTALAFTVAATAAMLAGCGDADPPAATIAPTTVAETPKEFAAHIETDCPAEDPGFDRFLAENPDPTLEQWAEFLDTPIGVVGSLATCLDALLPPAEVADEFQAVIDALGVVKTDLENAKAAAVESDEEHMNEHITVMREVNQPKIDEAVHAFEVAVEAAG